MLISAIIYVPFRMLYIKRKNKKIVLRKELLLTLFWGFVIGVISQTVFPKVNMGILDSGRFYFTIYYPPKTEPNLVPLRTIILFSESRGNIDWHNLSVVNLLGNILLFTPIGCFLPMAYPKCNGFRCVFSITLCSIVLIEILQYFCGRVADIDDVILNMIGVLLGYGIFFILNKIRGIHYEK